MQVLADGNFYSFFFRNALPTFLEQRRAGLLRGHGVIIHPTARISEPRRCSIGDRSSVGAYCNIHPSSEGIAIGKDVLIGPSVSIMGSNHRFDDPETPIREQGMLAQGVVIEDDVWIGCGSVVLPGVRVGKGAVVAAGAIVTRSVPPGVVVAGVPARVLRRRGSQPPTSATAPFEDERRPRAGGVSVSSSWPRPIRVAHVIGYPQRMAGANRSLLNLVRSYPPEVVPRVAVTAEGPVADAFRAAGVSVTVLPTPTRLGKFGGGALHWSLGRKASVFVREYAPFTWNLREWLAREPTDLVHTNDPRAALWAGVAARLVRRPLVAHMRGAKSFDGLPWRAFESLPSHIVAVSEGILEDLSPRGRRKARAIYNAVTEPPEGPPLPWLDHLRQRGVVVVAAFATLVPCKGCHHLLDAIAILNQRGLGDALCFVWVGGPTSETQWYATWIQERQRELALANFTLAGWQADPFRFHRSTDIVAFPSIRRESLPVAGRQVDVRGHEGLPRALLEALAHGRPAVASSVPGVPEIVVNDETGILVPPGDPAAMADALASLVSDPDRRQRMGTGGPHSCPGVFFALGVLPSHDRTLPNRTAPPPLDAVNEPPCAEG